MTGRRRRRGARSALVAHGQRPERGGTRGRTRRAQALAGAAGGARVRGRAARRADEPRGDRARRSSTGPRPTALVVTTGGTGLTPRDVTPQATAAVLDYEVPGIAEAMRADGRRSTPFAALSRGLVGVRGGTLIVNVPGLAEGRAGVVRGRRPAARPRARDAARARSTTPRPAPAGRDDLPRRRRRERRLTCSSRSPTVPLYPLVFPLFWGAAAFFVLAMARHLRVFAAARNASPTDRPLARLCGHGPLRVRPDPDVPRPAGRRSCTSGIFWGFVLLTIGTANIVTGGLIQAVVSIPFDGALWVAVTAMQNVVAVIVLVCVAWAYLAAPRRRGPTRLTLNRRRADSSCA